MLGCGLSSLPSISIFLFFLNSIRLKLKIWWFGISWYDLNYSVFRFVLCYFEDPWLFLIDIIWVLSGLDSVKKNDAIEMWYKVHLWSDLF
jgi:hypothetical protein